MGLAASIQSSQDDYLAAMGANIRSATQVIDGLDKMYALGQQFDADDPCNPVDIITAIIKQTADLLLDFWDQAVALGKFAGKNAIFLALVTLAEIYGANLLVGFQSSLSFLVGNVFGSILQSLAMIISAVDGIWMIFMYLAAGAAIAAHEDRINFINNNIGNGIDQLLELFEILSGLKDSLVAPYQEEWGQVNAAYDEVKKASIKLGGIVENKLAEGQPGFSSEDAIEVQQHLTNAVDLLLSGKYTEMMDNINIALESAGFPQLLGEAANIEISITPGGDTLTLADYATQVSGGDLNTINDVKNFFGVIRDTLFNISAVAEDITTSANEIWTTMLAQFDPLIQAIAIIEAVKADVGRLVDKTPIQQSQMVKFYDVLEDVVKENKLYNNKGADSYYANATDNWGLNTANANLADSVIGKLAGPELTTLDSVNRKCNATQRAVKFLKQNFLQVQMVGSALATIMMPIFHQLKNVRDDMEGWLSDNEAIIGNDLASTGINIGNPSRKMQWALDLEVIKGSISSVTASTIQLPAMGAVNWLDTNIAVQVEELWDDLVLYLSSEIYLSNKYENKQPGEVAYLLLQEMPAETWVSLTSGVTDNFLQSIDQNIDVQDKFIAYLQDIKSQLSLQKTLDENIILKCKNIREEIEKNPGFEVMMNSWSSITSSLSDGPLDILGPELAQGSLDQLLAATANLGSVVSNPVFANLGPCVKKLVPPSFAATFAGIDPVQLPEVSMQLNMERAQQVISKAQDEILKHSSGLMDSAKFKEFERKKSETLIQFQNQASKLQDTITRLLLIYSLISEVVGGD